MDVQNDTEIEVEFQVQGGGRDDTLGPGEAVRIEITKPGPFSVTFSKKDLGGKRILARVHEVEQDQAVHLGGYRAQVVGEHAPFAARRGRDPRSHGEADD